MTAPLQKNGVVFIDRVDYTWRVLCPPVSVALQDLSLEAFARMNAIVKELQQTPRGELKLAPQVDQAAYHIGLGSLGSNKKEPIFIGTPFSRAPLLVKELSRIAEEALIAKGIVPLAPSPQQGKFSKAWPFAL